MNKIKINQKSNRIGFTLVELVIVIAIVIILSVISVPIYRGYVDKAKWAEGYALMGAIISAQKAYYSEHGNFLYALDNPTVTSDFFTSNETILGIDARGNKYFTWFVSGGGDGSGRQSMKYFFAGVLKIPSELNGGYYRLDYNLTKGIISEKVSK